ncbi:MAG: hypothetical protein WBV69_09935 [Candidatus Sulfotelmatobacter sp.]
MVLELRDKLPEAAGSSSLATPARGGIEEDVLSALVNLGYQRLAAERTLERIVKTGASGAGKTRSFDAMFREALAALSK